MAILSLERLLILAGCFVVFGIIRLLRSKNNNLPPGPRGIPILGNINDLPPAGMLECHHWGKHKELYGPISSITVLGQNFIIINDVNIAFTLLKDQSAITSGRPNLFLSCEMIGWNQPIVFTPYTDTFRLHRKNFAKVAGSISSLQVFDRVQEEEAAHFLLKMLQTPEQLADHIRMQAGSVILRIAYGYTPVSHGNDPLVDMVGQTMDEFAEVTVPGKFLVDVIPLLRYLPDWCPGTDFKAKARRMAKQLERTAEQPLRFVKQQMREKRHKTSFLSQVLEATPEKADVHKWTAAAMYLGGADTTVAALKTFFLAMTVFPEVQRKAQEELDRVIGSERLPNTADKPNLPYIEAIMKETHRWHPIGPMGIPHTCDKEIKIMGYTIPKDSVLLPNIWWFTHDTSVYPQPDKFMPERFITTPTHTAEPDPRTFSFGFGRRVCPGRLVADNALFMSVAQVLSVYNIEKSVENGVVVEPVVAFEPGVVSGPLPYKTSVTPRSQLHRELILKAEKVYPWGESDAEALKTVQAGFQ